jgi:outer membrane immunogenic protein
VRRFFIAAAIAVFWIAYVTGASAVEPSTARWLGWYAGLNTGGNWGGDPVSSGASNSQFCPPPACNFASAFANASIQGASGELPGRTAGFIAGGQIGYNWPIAKRWVAGFETDIQGLAGASKSYAATASYDVAGLAGRSVATDLLTSKSIDFLSTMRGRLGYLVKPRLLIFGTGGFAFGHVKSNTIISQNLVGNGLGNFEPNFGTNASVSRLLGGWTLGAGFEWLLGPKWSAKFEYLYYDLGKVTTSGQLADRIVSPMPPQTYYFVNDVQVTTRFNGSIVRVGVNYRY